jgi:DNA polymerase epsilon subunit 1
VILTSYNGDNFDWPFIEKRSMILNVSLEEHIGILASEGEYYGRFLIHLDCFYWVQRDSYLP